MYEKHVFNRECEDDSLRDRNFLGKKREELGDEKWRKWVLCSLANVAGDVVS
jgi:hypothetical protein